METCLQPLELLSSYRRQWYDSIIALYVLSIIAAIVTHVAGILESVRRLGPAFGVKITVFV